MNLLIAPPILYWPVDLAIPPRGQNHFRNLENSEQDRIFLIQHLLLSKNAGYLNKDLRFRKCRTLNFMVKNKGVFPHQGKKPPERN